MSMVSEISHQANLPAPMGEDETGIELNAEARLSHALGEQGIPRGLFPARAERFQLDSTTGHFLLVMDTPRKVETAGSNLHFERVISGQLSRLGECKISAVCGIKIEKKVFGLSVAVNVQSVRLNQGSLVLGHLMGPEIVPRKSFHPVPD